MKLPFRLHSSPASLAPSGGGAFRPPLAPPLSLFITCKLQGAAQTGSQALRTAARPEEEDGDAEPVPASPGSPVLAEADSSLLALEGLRLRKPEGLENFHWGILGISMQKVVTASCSSPSGAGHGWAREVPGGGGDGVAVATLLLMAGFSEGVSVSFQKRSYLGSVSMPSRCLSG